MLSYQVYKLVHFGGLLLLFLAFGGILFGRPKDKQRKATLFALHGTGLLLLLIGGFGMLARLGLVTGLPPWVWMKLGVWLALGFIVILTKRKPEWKALLISTLVALGLLAAGIALYKPGW